MTEQKKFLKFSIQYDNFGFSYLGTSSGNVDIGFTCNDPALNLGLNTDFKCAEKNWRKMKASFNNAKYFLPIQVHSNIVCFIDHNDASRFYEEECDAYLVRSLSTSFAAVTVADCVPLLLFSEKQGIIGVIHAGWRGLYNGIVENMISLILKKSLDLNDITWVIGPHASECCYEVSEKIFKDFANRYEINPGKISGKSHLLSMKSIIYKIFEKNDVNFNRIYDVNRCTICDQLFYSFRRSGDDAGRFAGFVYQK